LKTNISTKKKITVLTCAVCFFSLGNIFSHAGTNAAGAIFLSVLTNAVKFQLNAPISPKNSGIVESVVFRSSGQAEMTLFNQSEMRVKPYFVIWVFNKNWLVIHRHFDAWLFDSIDPYKKRPEIWGYAFDIKEDLLFFRYLSRPVDLEPAYVLVAGSKYSHDKIIKQLKETISR